MKIRRFKYLLNCLNSSFRVLFRKIFRKNAPYFKINGSFPINNCKKANDIISSLIKQNLPFMISRFGSTELSILSEYFQIKCKLRDCFSKSIYTKAANCSGIFISNDEDMFKFCELFLSESSYLDYVGLWNDRDEIFTIKNFARQASCMTLSCLEPYYFTSNSWTHALKNKKILIISPFSESISKQYAVKDKLFDVQFWPKCTWIPYQSIQTIAGQKDSRFNNWFDALHYMENQISEIDFDIAIIGCGGYGLPLAAFIKRLGKEAIHLGGATQILFGVKGKRWEKMSVSHFFNSYWKYPEDKERPRNSSVVENSCYW